MHTGQDAVASGGATGRPGKLFRPQNWLDWVFLVSLLAKGLDGLAEVVGGVLLLVVTPGQIHHLVLLLTQHELSENPRDVVARYLVQTSQALSVSAVTFGAVYLLTHGVVKVVLIWAVLRERLWAYPWMIAALVLFIAYQLYRIGLEPTAGMIALTVFDVFIVALTVREYRLRRPAHQQPAAH